MKPQGVTGCTAYPHGGVGLGGGGGGFRRLIDSNATRREQLVSKQIARDGNVFLFLLFSFYFWEGVTPLKLSDNGKQIHNELFHKPLNWVNCSLATDSQTEFDGETISRGGPPLHPI